MRDHNLQVRGGVAGADRVRQNREQRGNALSEEFIFALEMLVERRPPDISAPDDIADRRPIVAALEDEIAECGQ
jgi:hypothetical protein